jgi:hypothetical protein
LEENSGMFIQKMFGLQFRNFHPEYYNPKWPQMDTNKI